MRGLLFARVNFSKPENGGIHLKCKGQLKALSKSFQSVDFLYFLEDGLYLNDDKVFHISPSHMQSRSRLAKLFMLDLGKNISKYIDLKPYDFLYFRYCLSSKGLLDFLQNFKKTNPNSKIICELPTYPYDKEYKGLARRFEFKIDQFYKKKVFAKIDRIAHLGTEKEIYQTPTLSFGNGISVEEFPIASRESNWNEFRLIAVGNFNYWHGIDRLLHGIQQYKGNTKIHLRIIGSGFTEAQSLSKELGVSSMIDFIGPLTKKALDDQYAWANFGIGTLGIHRKEVEINQSLKHREYAARGLNFIYAGNDPGFHKSCPGIVKVDETDQPLDIASLEDQLSDNAAQIKAHAMSHISWNVQFQNIIDFLSAK